MAACKLAWSFEGRGEEKRVLKGREKNIKRRKEKKAVCRNGQLVDLLIGVHAHTHTQTDRQTDRQTDTHTHTHLGSLYWVWVF